MVDKTRIVRLEAGQQRDLADNHDTLVVGVDALAPRCSFGDLFVQHYVEIRRTCMGFRKPGVAIIAVDLSRHRVAGSICVAAKPDTANAAIIGRHSMTDLYLDSDPGLSLRHLVLVVNPLSSDSDVRFRVIDLRTRLAFEDEKGQRFQALVAEGPIFLRCGNFALFCMVTGDPTDWPGSAEAGWQCIPERVYLKEEEAEPDRWQRRRPGRKQRDAPADARRVTRVQPRRGPTRAKRRLLGPGEEALGNLRVSTKEASQTLVIGVEATRRGILIGRYERCDTHGAKVLTHDNISRVHLLVLNIAGRLYAIDTASTNGTWVRDPDDTCREVRITPLEPAEELLLGEELAFVRWVPAEKDQ